MELRFDLDETQPRSWLLRINEFYKHVSWLVDSFVLDFHADSHWSKLPPAWQLHLQALTPRELGGWMEPRNKPSDAVGAAVCPLGLQAFRVLTQDLSLKRDPLPVSQCLQLIDSANSHNSAANNLEPELQKLFHRKVKLKKRHEIGVLSKIVTACAHRTGTKSLLDVGAGLGHLSRYLSSCHGLDVTCVDSEEGFIESARKLDTKLQERLSNSKMTTNGTQQPVLPIYVNKRLTFDQNFDLEPLEPRAAAMLGYGGLLGLHTCGDLGPLILSSFVSSDCTLFVVQLGCCYMKMDKGYPISRFLRHNLTGLRFSYEALELACHSIENYADRLKIPATTGTNTDNLRVHNHRAVLELLVRNKYPSLARAGMKSVRNLHTRTFDEYVRLATAALDIEFSSEELRAVEAKLNDWWLVVCFYSLRLMLAKVVETGVLLDRVLYLRERGCPSTVLPVFDPRISPRNFSIIGFKES